MQRRINEAEGKAEEIIAITKATADSIRAISETIEVPGGREAVNMRLSQQMITKLGSLANGQRVVLPADLMRVDDILKSVGLDGTNDGNRVPTPPPAPKKAPQPEPVLARPSTPSPPTMPQQPWPPPKPE